MCSSDLPTITANFIRLAAAQGGVTWAETQEYGYVMKFLGKPVIENNVMNSTTDAANTIDILFGGQTYVTYVNEGLMKPVKPQFVLPGVTEAKNWVGGQMRWVDKEQQYMFIGGHYVFGWPVYNSAFVKPASLQSWKDLLKPEFKGKKIGRAHV